MKHEVTNNPAGVTVTAVGLFQESLARTHSLWNSCDAGLRLLEETAVSPEAAGHWPCDCPSDGARGGRGAGAWPRCRLRPSSGGRLPHWAGMLPSFWLTWPSRRIERLVDEPWAALDGRIDVWVNNAGADILTGGRCTTLRRALAAGAGRVSGRRCCARTWSASACRPRVEG